MKNVFKNDKKNQNSPTPPPNSSSLCHAVLFFLGGRDPTVEFASVQPTPVQVFEVSETTVTTTVTVTFNEDRTDQVSGDNLWQVDLWFSKASDGAGSSSDGVSDVLSPAHASQPVDFDNFQFEVRDKNEMCLSKVWHVSASFTLQFLNSRSH